MSDEEDEGTERADFRVYNMPVKLINKYVSIAKLHYDNKVWKALEDGMQLLLQEHQKPDMELIERVAELEAKVGQLQNYLNSKEGDTSDIPKTLGGEANNPIDQLQKLKDRGEQNDKN